MASSYNHSAIEKKWRENWKRTPSMLTMERNQNIIVWICSHIRLAAAFMLGIGEVT